MLPSPIYHLDLAYSDVWLQSLCSRRILLFENPPEPSHEKAIGVLEAALQSLVDGTPELGRQVVLMPAVDEDKVPWRGIRPSRG